MRPLVVATVSAFALALGAVNAVPATAAAATPGGGAFERVAPRRVLDTRHGTYGNRHGAVRGGASITARVSGKDGVPSTVAAVVVSVTVLAPQRAGVLVAGAPSSHRPGIATVSFAAGQSVGDLAVVPVRHGRVQLWNVSHGSVGLTADVTGYYTGGRASAGHSYHAVTGSRVVDTRHGTAHNRRGALADGKTFSPQITGHGGVPRGATGVLATVTVLGPRTGGYVNAITYGGEVPPPTIRVSAHRQVSQLEVLPLSLSGRITLGNHTGSPAQLAVDVTGYFAGGPADTARMTQPVEASQVSTVSVAAHRSVHVAVAGHAGVPRAGVTAVIATLTALRPAAAGSLSSAGGTAPTVVQFAKGATSSGVTFAAVDGHGRITLSNSAARAVRVEVDVDGFVPTTAVPAASASTARYLDALTGDPTHDTAVMQAYGTADARAGDRLVLLDVGAQTVTAPSSPADPGVALAQVHTRVVLSYTQLVQDVSAYLTAYRAASGRSATVAVGTNNDGAWTPGKPNYYSPAARGRAWADDVVDPLRAAAPSGPTVLGADDIESQFASTESQAAAWEDAFLGATPAALVYNGDASGCPQTPGTTGRSCALGWTQAQYHHLASDRGRVLVLPQQFFPYEAAKWADIDASGTAHLSFLGSLTEHDRVATEQAPAAARAALYRALSANHGTVSLPYAPDL